MKKAKKQRVIAKFGDMPYGQWFKELGKDNPRYFIKIQNILPSGIQILHQSVVAKDFFDKDGTKVVEAGCSSGSYYNAIDHEGITGSCPDWVQFELVEPPFKQRYKHEHGKNLKLPRYPGDTANERNM